MTQSLGFCALWGEKWRKFVDKVDMRTINQSTATECAIMNPQNLPSIAQRSDPFNHNKTILFTRLRALEYKREKHLVWIPRYFLPNQLEFELRYASSPTKTLTHGSLRLLWKYKNFENPFLDCSWIHNIQPNMNTFITISITIVRTENNQRLHNIWQEIEIQYRKNHEIFSFLIFTAHENSKMSMKNKRFDRTAVPCCATNKNTHGKKKRDFRM